MRDKLNFCWRNCGALTDERLLADKEVLNIDRLEDRIAPLDDNMINIRKLITRFESCYFQADKEAEMIVRAIASGQPPVESNERPPQRKRNMQNSLNILLAWYDETASQCANLSVGGIGADQLLECLGDPTDLKKWQVQRLIEKHKDSLNRSCCYHNMELSTDGYGNPLEINLDDYYKDHLDFLTQTRAAMIHFILDGKPDQLSLALSIDLFRPHCNWNYVGNLVILLKAINGELHSEKTFAPCCFNAKLTPLRERLKVISNTLKAFCEGQEKKKDVDNELLALLGNVTDPKRWLAASLGKTIRLQQSF